MKRIRIEKIFAGGGHCFLWVLLLVGFVFLFTNVCSGGGMEKKQHADKQRAMLEQISQQKWDSLAQKKIFFGHQSVGNNIMQGVNEIQANYKQIRLNVIRTKDKSDFEEPVFGHFEIGKNEYSLTKIDDFVQIMADGLGNKVDIAFLKFCFVDIQSGTDIENVFQTYTKSIAELTARYPNMTIVHFTVPLLRAEKEGTVKRITTFFKGLVGKKQENFFSPSHNVARNRYNAMLINHYAGKEPIFDLAKLESTDPAGQRKTFSYDGHKYYALVSEYTDDGGHLNDKGRQYIAEQLLILLVNLQAIK